MGYSARVTSKGQITIPSDVRSEFGIEQGDDLLFYKGLDGSMRFRVRKLRKGAGAGSFVWPDAPKDARALREAIGAAIDEKHARKP